MRELCKIQMEAHHPPFIPSFLHSVLQGSFPSFLPARTRTRTRPAMAHQTNSELTVLTLKKLNEMLTIHLSLSLTSTYVRTTDGPGLAPTLD